MVDLSICIVTLNASDFLRNCLNSICKQSESLIWLERDPQDADTATDQEQPNQQKLSLEVIIVDNGSTDDTVEMLHTE